MTVLLLIWDILVKNYFSDLDQAAIYLVFQQHCEVAGLFDWFRSNAIQVINHFEYHSYLLTFPSTLILMALSQAIPENTSCPE